jgi:hypothetical protein
MGAHLSRQLLHDVPNDPTKCVLGGKYLCDTAHSNYHQIDLGHDVTYFSLRGSNPYVAKSHVDQRTLFSVVPKSATDAECEVIDDANHLICTISRTGLFHHEWTLNFAGGESGRWKMSMWGATGKCEITRDNMIVYHARVMVAYGTFDIIFEDTDHRYIAQVAPDGHLFDSAPNIGNWPQQMLVASGVDVFLCGVAASLIRTMQRTK